MLELLHFVLDLFLAGHVLDDGHGALQFGYLLFVRSAFPQRGELLDLGAVEVGGYPVASERSVFLAALRIHAAERERDVGLECPDPAHVAGFLIAIDACGGFAELDRFGANIAIEGLVWRFVLSRSLERDDRRLLVSEESSRRRSSCWSITLFCFIQCSFA